MKYHLGFLAGLFGILCLISYLLFSFNEHRLFLFQGASDDVTHVINSFRKSHDPQLEINFSELYGGSGKIQVLHPLLEITNIQLDAKRPSCIENQNEGMKKIKGQSAVCTHGPFLYVKSKDADIAFGSLSSIERKDKILARFLNNEADLPSDFLTTPPFVNSYGNSYAYLLTKRSLNPFGQKSWVQKHLSHFKISELKEILSYYEIKDPTYHLISKLNNAEIEDVVRGSSLILTQQHLFIKYDAQYGFSPLSYLVYDLKDFENHIKDSKYELASMSTDSLCLQKIGNACWTYNSKHALASLNRYALVILLLLITVFFTFLALYLKRVYEKHKEQQKHRLSLQVLSHEFRTPVTSMLLMMDQLRNSSRDLHPVDQDLLTRISSEIYRLQRVVEVSKTYLQAEGHRIHFKETTIPSINDWISDFVEESNYKIGVELLTRDQKFVADPFWLKFILSNLVQNSFAHGCEPVAIRLNNSNGKLKITVEDQGHCEFKSLNEMTSAFVKSSRSKGMGLGLNIVKFIADEWGGEIHFSNAPTTFTLSFENKEIRTV